MPNKPALKTVRKRLDDSLQSAGDLFVTVQEHAEGTWDSINGYETLVPGQARRIVGLAFLQMVIAWEDFIEACFVRYMMGASSPNGWSPVLRLGAADSLAHAYQLASGNPKYQIESHFMSWTSWGDIIDRAKLYFEGGEPFATVPRLSRDRLLDATKIRNRVAHSSPKVRSEFVTLAKSHLGLQPSGVLPQGYSPGQLLVHKSTKCFGAGTPMQPFFLHYLGLFGDMADHICPTS
jgi:hypothetical protein